ncbi:RNA polymerase sigma factor [Jiangella muralis]|uniref:RNA polymerase sigma factor n=1 Tax=Jiangella muralis TaxID=702383 RepID=UPI00069CC81B|nr:RNA polymerase sigma factor [Jiangella muralis]
MPAWSTHRHDDETTRRGRFEAVFAAESRAILGYALRRVEAAEDAADVVAETFLVAWRRIDDVPAGAQARPWLYGVARRVLANHARGARRRTRLGERLRDELLTGPDVIRIDEDDPAATVRAALLRLPGDDRELLRLTSWEGLGPAELATAMGLPPGTVRTRLHRARKRLRAELEALGRDGERPAPTGHVNGDGRLSVRLEEGS